MVSIYIYIYIICSFLTIFRLFIRGVQFPTFCKDNYNLFTVRENYISFDDISFVIEIKIVFAIKPTILLLSILMRVKMMMLWSTLNPYTRTLYAYGWVAINSRLRFPKRYHLFAEDFRIINWTPKKDIALIINNTYE